MLTEEERKIIEKKIKPDKNETIVQAFNRILEVRDNNGNLDQQATADNAILVSNFIARAGGRWDSPMWRQITELKGITVPHLVVEIPDHRAFIKAAEAEGFRRVIFTDWLFSLTPWGYHRYHSVREVTPVSTDFSMHFANDDGDNTYYVHWDPTSITYLSPTWSIGVCDALTAAILDVAEWVYRGLFHGSFPKPAEVRRQLIDDRKTNTPGVEISPAYPLQTRQNCCGR
jgi:hypothetical protein